MKILIEKCCMLGFIRHICQYDHTSIFGRLVHGVIFSLSWINLTILPKWRQRFRRFQVSFPLPPPKLSLKMFLKKETRLWWPQVTIVWFHGIVSCCQLFHSYSNKCLRRLKKKPTKNTKKTLSLVMCILKCWTTLAIGCTSSSTSYGVFFLAKCPTLLHLLRTIGLTVIDLRQTYAMSTTKQKKKFYFILFFIFFTYMYFFFLLMEET